MSDTCIVNLQEVSVKNYEIISDLLQLPSACSLDHRKLGKFEGKNRQMGIATFVKGGSIENTELLNNTVFPERTLLTSIEMNSTSNITYTIKNLAFHALTGCDYSKAKSSNFASIASYLYENPVEIMCCDANEPFFDSIDDEKVVCFDNKDKGKNASYLFGNNKVHSLVDAYKSHCKTHNIEIVEGYTHIVSHKKKRYDHVHVHNTWSIKNVETLYEKSKGATSDHGMVKVIVEL